jgi:hypothetical protein
VIKSLPPNEQSWFYRTGAHLFEELQDSCARMPVEPQLHVIRTRQRLCYLLRLIIMDAEVGQFPLLHFETHGVERAPGKTTTSIGLALASGEVMSWRDLAPYLTAINEATRLNLIVFVAACYGLDIATLFQPLHAAPGRIVIGAMRPIEVPEIDRATRAFYQSLFRDRNGVAASQAMNATIAAGRTPLLVLTAERSFSTYWWATTTTGPTTTKLPHVRNALLSKRFSAECRRLPWSHSVRRCVHFFVTEECSSTRRTGPSSSWTSTRRSLSASA